MVKLVFKLLFVGFVSCAEWVLFFRKLNLHIQHFQHRNDVSF